MKSDVLGVRLSANEESVLRLLAWGYTNKEAADRLNLSVKTIDAYRGRLIRKLGFRSRVDLVEYAVQHHWLDERPFRKSPEDHTGFSC